MELSNEFLGNARRRMEWERDADGGVDDEHTDGPCGRIPATGEEGQQDARQWRSRVNVHGYATPPPWVERLPAVQVVAKIGRRAWKVGLHVEDRGWVRAIGMKVFVLLLRGHRVEERRA